MIRRPMVAKFQQWDRPSHHKVFLPAKLVFLLLYTGAAEYSYLKVSIPICYGQLPSDVT
jgi:hypothetical protein